MFAKRSVTLALTAPLVAVLLGGGVAVRADAAARPAWTKNCTALHKKYVHGVGRVNAIDKTSSTRVRNFKKSNSLYATAMRWNKGLDRDRDKIACEQK